MNGALRLLTWLRFVGWLRRLARMLRTVKGALLALFVGLICTSWIFSLIMTAALKQQTQNAEQRELARQYGPVLLLGYCVALLAFPSSERVIAFTPAEVNFLFAGPFSRRQLLAYKISVITLKTAMGTLFLAVVFQPYAAHFAAA